MGFSSPKTFDGFEEVSNIKNTIYMEGERYYMKIEGLDNYTYAAKIRINL